MEKIQFPRMSCPREQPAKKWVSVTIPRDFDRGDVFDLEEEHVSGVFRQKVVIGEHGSDSIEPRCSAWSATRECDMPEGKAFEMERSIK